MPRQDYADTTPELVVDPTTPSARASVGWAVLVTHPQAERWAEQNLRHIGYQVFIPTYATRRRDPVLRTLTREVVLPLFPGYGFVWWSSDTPWMPIVAAPGVRTMLMSGTNPAYAPTAAVAALQAGEASRQAIPAANTRWQPGQPCTLAQGALRKLPAVITRITGNTATISLMMLGHLRDITIPLEQLSPRSEPA